MINGNCSSQIEDSLIFIFNFLKKKRFSKKDFFEFLDYIVKLTDSKGMILEPRIYYPENIDIDPDILNKTKHQKKSIIKHNSLNIYIYRFKHPLHFRKAILIKNKQFTKKEQEFLKTLFSFWDFVNFERKQKEKLKRHVYVDILTGLYNRYFLENVIPRELKKVERYNQPLSVLFIDIDNFKYINDIYGHQVGDDVLKLIGKIFKENIRKTDIPIRYGGDEFLIFLPFTKESSAVKFAQKLKDLISTKIRSKLGIDVTISIGIIEVKKGDTLDHILDKLDDLLYTAKSYGKDKIVAEIER